MSAHASLPAERPVLAERPASADSLADLLALLDGRRPPLARQLAILAIERACQGRPLRHADPDADPAATAPVAAGECLALASSAADWPERLARLDPQLEAGAWLLFELAAPDDGADRRSTELAWWADRHGYRVIAATPFDGVGSGAANRWLGALGQRHAWQRLLGWAMADARLADFIGWLERELVWPMPIEATGRCLAVLQKGADRAANADWLARQQARAADLAAGLPAALPPAFGEEQWAVLDAALARVRNASLFDQLLGALRARWPGFDAAPWLSPAAQALLDHWDAQAALDDEALRIAADWYRGGEFAAAFHAREVPLGPGFEYNMVRGLLVEYLDAFGGEMQQ